MDIDMTTLILSSSVVGSVAGVVATALVNAVGYVVKDWRKHKRASSKLKYKMIDEGWEEWKNQNKDKDEVLSSNQSMYNAAVLMFFELKDTLDKLSPLISKRDMDRLNNFFAEGREVFWELASLLNSPAAGNQDEGTNVDSLIKKVFRMFSEVFR